MDAKTRKALLAVTAILTELLDEPAKPASRSAKPKVSKPKAVPTTKGTQDRSTLSRKDWNRTLTAKARLAGKVEGTDKSVYSEVLDNWTSAQIARENGYTPDQFLAVITD